VRQSQTGERPPRATEKEPPRNGSLAGKRKRNDLKSGSVGSDGNKGAGRKRGGDKTMQSQEIAVLKWGKEKGLLGGRT